MSKIVIVGDIMFDYFFLSNEWTLPLELYTPQLGGILFNTAKASLGIFDEITSIASVGEKDESFIKKQFIENGFYDNIFFLQESPTGFSVIFNHPDTGERTGMIAYRSANCLLNISQTHISTIGKFDFLFLNGLSFLPSSDTSKSCLYLMDLAKDIGAKIIFDLLPHHLKKHMITSNYKEALKKTDILISEKGAFEEVFSLEENHITNSSELYYLIQDVTYHLIFTYVHKLSIYYKNNLTREILTGYEFKKSPRHYLDKIALDEISRLTF